MYTSPHNHPSDEELVKYMNSRDQMQDTDIQKIERHLHIANCSRCRAKVNELEKLNHMLGSISADDSAEEGPDICSWLEKVAAFVHKRMSSVEREEFIAHMADCDACRKATALLASAMPSKAGDGKGTDTNPAVWHSIRAGIIRLSKTISLGGEGMPDNFFTPSLEAAGEKFRGQGDDPANHKKSMEISLPENNGDIKLTYFEEQGQYNKIAIEPIGAICGELRIEIYDQNNNLLKSIDGSKPVSCLVKKGGYSILINSRFEIPLNLG